MILNACRVFWVFVLIIINPREKQVLANITFLLKLSFPNDSQAKVFFQDYPKIYDFFVIFENIFGFTNFLMAVIYLIIENCIVSVVWKLLISIDLCSVWLAQTSPWYYFLSLYYVHNVLSVQYVLYYFRT